MKFQGKNPLFIQISDYFEKLIDSGAFKPGDFLPSVREIAILENINPNTVNKAYMNLAEKGYIISIPKKGYYVSDLKENNRDKVLKSKIEELLKTYDKNEIIEVLRGFSNMEVVKKWLRLKT